MPINPKKIILSLCLLAFSSVLSFAQKNAGTGNTDCSIRSGNLDLKWVKVNNVKSLKLPAKVGTTRLPLRYTVYKTDAAKLNRFMVALKSNGGLIVLPAAGTDRSCVSFATTPSGTMSPELAAKFPQLVSLKGADPQDASATIRLNYDGNRLDAEMYIGGIPYILAPWKKNSVTYYLLYKKEDSGVQRKSLSE